MLDLTLNMYIIQSIIISSLSYPALTFLLGQFSLSRLENCVHSYNASYQIPISIGADPITHHDPRTAVSDGLLRIAPLNPYSRRLVMPSTQEVNNLRVHLGSNLIRPAVRPPEIRCAQKIQEEWLLGLLHVHCVEIAREHTDSLRRSF